MDIPAYFVRKGLRAQLPMASVASSQVLFTAFALELARRFRRHELAGGGCAPPDPETGECPSTS